jgi:triosephosphate isomerase
MLKDRERAITIGVSLKMYFGYGQTVAWCEKVKEISAIHPAITSGLVELFVIPSFPVLSRASELLAGTRIRLGAQNLYWEDDGPFTGEVSGSMLAEIGCAYVEVGHAERRRIFGETDAVVAAKVEASQRNGLIPVICIGELDRLPPDQALKACVIQLDAALNRWDREAGGRVIVAYEPVWAIGASEAAPPDHIEAICHGLRRALRAEPSFESEIIYGGTAGTGLVGMLHRSIDGLFLGRSAHDPSVLKTILDEAAVLCE